MLMQLSEVVKLIKDSKPILVAADENLLKQLPQGNWIGGTIPYFMDNMGGRSTKEEIFVTQLPEFISIHSQALYDDNQLADIPKDASDSGFTILVIPALSKTHSAWGKKAPTFENIFLKPIVGWIAGHHLDDLGDTSAKVIDGATGILDSQKCVAMHCSMPSNKVARIGIINIFKQGDGDIITFPEEGFNITECMVNGETVNFADYIKEKEIDTRLPLVCNYHGSMVNVSFQAVHHDKHTVDLYAPVFTENEYKIAAPVSDYVNAFETELKARNISPLFTCNCILNYLYGELEGKTTGNFIGPITFGEIAYQLLNQTMTYLEIKDA